jgi:hypothetical protein
VVGQEEEEEEEEDVIASITNRERHVHEGAPHHFSREHVPYVTTVEMSMSI